MKNIAMICLLLITAAVLGLPRFARAVPAMYFDSETHDFGTVKQGELLECTFDFVNAGDAELAIIRLTPS